MIAVITSTISPEKGKDEKSFFTTDERYHQTVETINRLKLKGFERIYLADNSTNYNLSSLASLFPDLVIRTFQQYQFANKSINEILMLLGMVADLPDNTPIFKISGRYLPTDEFLPELRDDFDFTVKGYSYHTKRGTISTRGYFIKNKVVFEKFLQECLSEIFAYPHRVVGFRSLLLFLNQLFQQSISLLPTTSIEFAAARVLKLGNYKVELRETLGISGQIAGFESRDIIVE